MSKNKSDADSIRNRNYKFLLYPDNEVHLRVMDAIEQNYHDDFIAIQHYNLDDDGNKIVEGFGKIHYHYAICSKNALGMGAVCRKIGLLDDLGNPDMQFCREISGRYSGFLLYLTHDAYDDKEHYDISELFGSERLIQETQKAVMFYRRKNLEMSDAVLAILDWISMQDGKISWSYFSRWVCCSPYFRASSHYLVRMAIQEHNDGIFDRQRKEYIRQIQEGNEIMQEIRCSGYTGRVFEFPDIEDIEDLKQLTMGWKK